MSRLDDIFDSLSYGYEFQMSDYAGSRTEEKAFEEQGLHDIAEAKQVIKDLMLELIGDDEPVPTHYGKRVPISRSNTAFQMHYRNKLRAELRAKVEEL